MSTKRELAATVTAATLIVALAGTSAFAESRPRNETSRRSEGRIEVRGERETRRPEMRRRDESRNEPRRGEARGEVRREPRNDGRWRGDARPETNRNRDRSYDRNRGYDRHDRQPYQTRGRVSRVAPYRGGYHVWVGGAPYPFFVPHNDYHRNRFRIGVVIDIGGWYNPLGYYDYYDARYDRYNRYDRYDGYRSGSTRAEMVGTVESIDYRRYSFVLRNDATGNFITVQSRDRNVDVRPGDVVEVRGNWRRGGYFEAYDVDLLD